MPEILVNESEYQSLKKAVQTTAESAVPEAHLETRGSSKNNQAEIGIDEQLAQINKELTVDKYNAKMKAVEETKRGSS
jgi:hypothetical protein